MNDNKEQRNKCTRCKVSLPVSHFKPKRNGDLYKRCIVCNEKCTIHRKSICDHNIRRSICKECDPLGHLCHIVRSQVYKALTNDKELSSIEYLGCTMEEYREFIQEQFKEGMTWQNYGKEWHIDHKVPLKYGKPTLEEIEERLKYTNTQPKRAYRVHQTTDCGKENFKQKLILSAERCRILQERYDKLAITSLELGKDFQIEHREEDGYINVTNLCKAGGKKFAAWKRLNKTKEFLKVLSASVLISTDALMKYESSSNEQRATWVHPLVAINIAQWISPRFDVKVSGWVYEVMITGKVDISNTKSYK